MSMNKIFLIGNVGRDPEMRYTPNGNPVTSFSVATNRRYTTGEGEQRDETEWFNVSAWNKLAETCNQYVTKGMKVFVDGRLSTREYTGADGQQRTSLDVTAFDVRFLDRSGDREESVPPGTAAPGTAAGDFSPGAAPDTVEDLPW